MSFILMFFYWVVIPVAVILVARRLWINSKNALSKSLVVSISVIMFIGLWWWAVGETWSLDRQVRALCEKDGGVKVYETVPLSPESLERLGKYGGIQIPVKSMKKPSDKYYFEHTSYYYVKGNPSMWRSHYQLFRQRDGKLLGESIRYSRRGGGLPGPWHESSFGCPDELSATASIFVKGE